MDESQSSRGFREGEEAVLTVSYGHNGGLHEESRHIFRLHEEAVPQSCRCTMPRFSAKQKIRTSELILFFIFIY